MEEEVKILEQSRAKLYEYLQGIADDLSQPLEFASVYEGSQLQGHTIERGILWIPPFIQDFWSNRRKKPKPNKCICACCGHKHNLKS